MLEEGGTIDIYVANLGVSYESHVQKKYEKGHTTNTPDQNQLQGMLDKVRAKRNDGKAKKE